MNVIATAIPDLKIFEPKVFGDACGFLFESFNHRVFEEAIGYPVEFVQDDHSKSGKNVVCGLHYQIHHAQGRLVRVVAGEVFDVAVDWPISGKALVSGKDEAAPAFKDAEYYCNSSAQAYV